MADLPMVREAPPLSAYVTEYDRSHLKSYLRLLDADADDEDWREAAATVLGLDVYRDPERVLEIHHTHIPSARAGFPH